MIWDTDSAALDPAPAVTTAIAEEIAVACGGESLHPEHVREVARGVATYLQQRTLSGALTSDLAVLESRALYSIGERGLARRLLVFGSGLVRPSEWTVTGDCTLWILDLKRLTLREDDRFELALFASLGVVLDEIAGVWDSSGGAGLLGLRHVREAATAVLGKPANRRRTGRLCGEVRLVCERKLEDLRIAHGWRETPAVMILDAGTAG